MRRATRRTPTLLPRRQWRHRALDHTLAEQRPSQPCGRRRLGSCGGLVASGTAKNWLLGCGGAFTRADGKLCALEAGQYSRKVCELAGM